MRQRGRKTVDNLLHLADARKPKLVAPDFLTEAEAAIFNKTVETAGHLAACDIPLLATLAQVTAALRAMASAPTRAADW